MGDEKNVVLWDPIKEEWREFPVTKGTYRTLRRIERGFSSGNFDLAKRKKRKRRNNAVRFY